MDAKEALKLVEEHHNADYTESVFYKIQEAAKNGLRSCEVEDWFINGFTREKLRKLGYTVSKSWWKGAKWHTTGKVGHVTVSW